MSSDILYYITNQSGNLSIQEILFNMVAGVIAGGIVFLSYKLSHQGPVYSSKFNTTLWMLTVVTTMVMCVIGNNVALSLGMVGALSIVRFRTAIKDARDTAYIFWCVAAGICCGISDFTIALCGSVVIFLLMLVIGNSQANNRYLLIVRGNYSAEAADAVSNYVDNFFQNGVRHVVTNRSLGFTEYIFELSEKQADQFNTEKASSTLLSIEGTETVNLVGQNDGIV